MYRSYFGLIERPFALTPDPRFLYLSERHREALSHLLYGLGEQGGFVQLTGEVGTGKTTLCRHLLERLPADVDVALILNSRLSATELVEAICDELHIEYPRGSTSLKTLVDALYRYLLAAHGRGRRTVLVVDEAQNLSVDALEQVRMLTNLETSRDKLLQIILIGQPELAEVLGRRELRQLAQRITARYHLLPFDEQETRAYVLYRMRVAGQPDRVFDDGALRETHRLAGGIPRLINVICDRALLGAYATRRKDVDAGVIRRAADEVLGTPAPPSAPLGRRPRWLPVAAITGTAAASAAVLLAVVEPASVMQRLDLVRRVTPGPAMPFSARPATPGLADPVVTAASAVARSGEAGAAERADVRTLLARPATAAARATALARLYASWGVDLAGTDAALACAPGRGTGLECFTTHGSWSLLRRLDMPSLLELVTPSGEARYAVVTALDGDNAVLEFDRGRYLVSRSDLESAWRGTFTLLWRPPALEGIPMGPGARGVAVAWLRQRLAEAAGRQPGGSPSQVFDQDLQTEVIKFQVTQFLEPDGIVGEQTLIRLAAVLDPRTPSLSGGWRRG